MLSILAILFYSAVVIFLISGLGVSPPRTPSPRLSISVVVAARNEETGLPKCLEALVNQDYTKSRLEIIIVDDRSEDSTPEILSRYKKRFPGLLNTITIPKTAHHASPKKYALSRGIESARGDLIFTTDADCQPPTSWISDMVPFFTEDIGLVIGPAPFAEEATCWHHLLAADNLAKECLAAGAAGWNIATTCTGRNLAYRKKVFEELNGFERFRQSLSGDDDLFVQQVATRSQWHITYALDPRVAVPSPAVKSLFAFVSQRRRHVSAGKYYTPKLQTAFFLFNLANLWLFLSWGLSCFGVGSLPIATVFLTIKLVLDFSALNLMAKYLEKKKVLLIFPLWEIFNLFNQVVISPLGFVGNIKWK
ncbi:MAG: glycosyltransferase [bacterium]